MTRFRAELVVVKSQAASVLRRMDGLAATTDGMQSGNEIVLERLVHVEKALKAVGDRIPAARDGGDSWGAGTTEGDTVRVINEIKVRRGTGVQYALFLRVRCRVTSTLLALYGVRADRCDHWWVRIH